MTKRHLFTALCEIADALQEEGVRLAFSPLKIALGQVVDRLDDIIDQVLEDGVQEEENTPSALRPEGRSL